MSHPMHIQERNQDATVYVGDLDQQVSEPLLWELFLNAGPVVNVHIPKDKLTGLHSGYGFVEFNSEEDADYGLKIMNMIKLYGKPIRVNKASQDKKTLDVGANLFIGNIDPEVDEKLLYDTFGTFGVIIATPKIMRDDTGGSKSCGFISYDSFESSDAAINAMNGQYLGGRAISVTYARKKDGKGEVHGSAAERLLAANNPNSLRIQQQRPGFAAPPSARPPGMVPMGIPAPPMGLGAPMGGRPPMMHMGMGMPFSFPPPPPGFPMMMPPQMRQQQQQQQH